MIFLHIFLPILYNIISYTYTVRYISGIKYLVFSKRIQKKIQKKNLKTFNLISLFKKEKRKKYFIFIHTVKS
jgi:predicted membrane protein